MPLRLTKRGGIVSKPRSNTRSSASKSSPSFATYQRTKPAALRAAEAAEKELRAGEPSEDLDNALYNTLEDHGLITHLESDQSLRDVAQYAQWIQENMFDEIPERAGMNSTRIAEVLNYRRNLPPIVTRAHIHALCKSPTATEREIAELIRAGVVRKIEVTGRGTAQHRIGECLVLTEEWVRMVRQHATLPENIKDKYVRLLKHNRGDGSIGIAEFTREEAASLAQAGFLTAPSMPNTGTLLRQDSSTVGSLLSLASAGSRSISGTLDAVGGSAAIHDNGGGGTGRSISGIQTSASSAAMKFVVPSVGPYLKLLSAAREYLAILLSKSRQRQAPVSLLKDRWDTATTQAGTTSRSSGVKDTPILPGYTKKWKSFHGLRFQWVLEECLGSGLIEVFETGSVGLGARLVA